MLKCTKEINEEQVSKLLQFRNNPTELKYQTQEDLINIEWDDLRWKGDVTSEEAKRPVDLNPTEQMMTNDVEELSEDMRRESEEETRASLGKT